MEEVVLQGKARQVIGKQVRALRREGLLPAVIYGHHLAPITISLNLHDSTRVLPRVSSSQLMTLDVDGTRHTVLVREKQRHPVTGTLLHIDFQAVSMTETIRIMVGLEFIGEAPAVKIYNGIVMTSREQVEVEALPRDLPSSIPVDLGKLAEIGDAVHVRDLDIPAKVTILDDPDEVVVIIGAPAAEPEVEEGASAEPEVIEKGKKEEEEF